MDSYFVSAGVRIRFITVGAGEPVVLVHGYTGRLDEWLDSGVFAVLAGRYSAIAFDCRGHGYSDKPHDPALYGPEMGLDIVRLLAHLGYARAHLIGYSMGAHILAHLLTTHPSCFQTATLAGAPGRLEWSEADERRVEIEAAEMEAGLLRTQTLRIAPPGRPALTEAELKTRSEEQLAGQDRFALAAVRRSNRTQVVTAAQMRAVSVPTLGLVGTADPYLEGYRRLQSWMPKLHLVTIADASHASAQGRPEFKRALLDFLSAHPMVPGA